MKTEDISRVIMAMAAVMGIWDREMRIPDPSRAVWVEHEGGHWKLDARGYPVPSQALLGEIRYLEEHEAQS